MSRPTRHDSDSIDSALGRRELLAYTAAFGTTFLAAQGLVKADDKEPAAKPVARDRAPKRYDMQKSINLWAFPYPDKWSLRESNAPYRIQLFVIFR